MVSREKKSHSLHEGFTDGGLSPVPDTFSRESRCAVQELHCSRDSELGLELGFEGSTLLLQQKMVRVPIHGFVKTVGVVSCPYQINPTTSSIPPIWRSNFVHVQSTLVVQ